MARPIRLDVTDDTTTMPKASAVHPRRMISIAKNTPARGALNVAAMPPAAPQATSSFTLRSSRWNSCAREDPSAEPICTIGPSRPTEPPPADAQRTRQRLHDRDLRPDAASMPGDRDHDLGDTMAARLPRKPLDQRAVEQTGDDRGKEHEPAPECRQVRVAHVTEAGVVTVTGEDLGQPLDEIPEAHGPQPGADTDQQSKTQDAMPPLREQPDCGHRRSAHALYGATGPLVAVASFVCSIGNGPAGRRAVERRDQLRRRGQLHLR